jgi:ribose/xylose/arabinose/galactoside ABC-type transport system permease subunit
MIFVVRYSRFGRHLYAIGGNEEAAHLSGISVPWAKIGAYTICAAMAALAGISNASRLELGDPEAGSTYELDAIAAVVIGGTSMNGGRGGMFLTLIGTLIIGYINKILSINNVEEAQRLLVKGVIIILAVLIQQKKREK